MGCDKNLCVDLQNIVNKDDQNLIIKGIKDCNPDVVNLLVEQAIDIDYKDKNGLNAMDHAWDGYIKSRNGNDNHSKYNDIVLILLNANSKYPEDKSCLTSKYFSSDIKKFVDDHQMLHDHLENLDYDLIKTNLANMPGNLCHFYDINNISLMNHAMQNYNKKVYDMLSSHGISIGSHEDPDVVFEEFKKGEKFEKEAAKIKFTNQNNALELSNIHVCKIMLKFKVINNCGNQHRHRTKVIKDALTHIDSDENCSKVLKVAAACKYLKGFADFKHKAANFIDPVCSKRTLGLTTTTGIIRIGAKDLLNESTKNEFMGTMIHELCHLAILMTFLNAFNPYATGDKDAKDLFDEAAQECFLNKDQEGLINGVFENYPKEHHHSELIVIIVHMTMKYHGKYDNNGVKMIENRRRIFPKLFEYFDDIVAPALDEVLDILIILQNSMRDVSYEDITQHQKNRIKHKANSILGTETTFADILGQDEEIYKQLTGKEIRYFLFNEETSIFECPESTGDPSDLKRRFIGENDDANAISDGYTLVKSELDSRGIFLLLDNAGTGKTEAFIDLSKQFKKEFKDVLVLLVDMSNQLVINNLTKWMKKVSAYTEKIDFSAFSNFIVEVLKLKSDFEKQIIQTLFDKNKIIFVFDGIDKINANLLKFFIKVVQLLKAKPSHVENGTLFKVKLLISSCPTTIIKRMQLCPTICEKSYKLVEYLPEERISYIFDATSKTDNGKRLVDMVRYIWLFNQVEFDQEHKLANISTIKLLMEYHNDPKNISQSHLHNIFTVFNHLYQLKNVAIKYDPKRSFTLLKILQNFALISIVGNSIEFGIIKSWNREKRHWASYEFENYGLVYCNTEDQQNDPKFIHKTCPEYFATTYLILLLFGEDENIREDEFKNAVNCLRIVGKSPTKYRIIHKLMLQYIKADQELSFHEDAKSQLIRSIQHIRQDIINSYELVNSLKFWSVLLSKDQEILKLLWQPDAEDNLLKTVIVVSNQKSVNFIKILKIVSSSFGTDWHKIFLVKNLISQNPTNGLKTDDCEEFNNNLNFFIEFIAIKLDKDEIRTMFDKILTEKVVVRHTSKSNIENCLIKCRDIFKNDEEFFIHIFKRFLYNTNNPTVLLYFGVNFEKLLENNEKSIKDVLFSTNCTTSLILISMSHCSSLFNTFITLFNKYDNSGIQVYNHLNNNSNLLRVFLLVTESNFLDVKNYLKVLYSSKFHKLIDCIENVDKKLKNDLISNGKKLNNFSDFLSEVCPKFPNICEKFYCSKEFIIEENILSLNDQYPENVTKLYVVYSDLMGELLNYFVHKCDSLNDYKFELHDYPENYKAWFKNNKILNNSQTIGLFLKFGQRFYLKNKKEFDEIVLKSFKIDEKNLMAILNDINKKNSNDNQKILEICKRINRALKKVNLFNENNVVSLSFLFV